MPDEGSNPPPATNGANKLAPAGEKMGKLSRADMLTRAEVEELTGLSGRTIDRLEHRGDFPLRYRISARNVLWHRLEVLEWLHSRPRGIAGATR